LAQQRISQAQRLLAATDKKIVDVAFSSGFGSVSQFYDVFTRHCHQSPKDFRRRQKQYYRADGGKSVLGD
jgi:AraC-like DNA-binding protein